jgi:BsuBI/PstI restriction endonuclease domain/BsuBI/PstI restriction endonuclease HTH domain
MDLSMLPPLLDVDGIRARLQVIFPDGTPERTKCTGLAAARTIYVMLYVGAIEGGEWLAPKYVYRMGESQAAKISDAERNAYLTAIKKPGTPEPADRWYRENTRESIRDEALKNGLVPIGAVLVNPHVPTTSSKGRYILRGDLAALFDPALASDKFEAAAAGWRGKYLTPNALAMVKVLQVAATGATSKIQVMLPSGEGRVMVPGLSSIITKAVVEIFAPRFLTNPAVVWISESGRKVVEKDDKLLQLLGIKISPEKLLPDIILAETAGGDLLFVFVEVVATDGPIHEDRRAGLLKLITDAGFRSDQAAFLTAFQSRNHAAFKKAIDNLAWGTFAWCFSEPEHLIAFDGATAGAVKSLREFLPTT